MIEGSAPRPEVVARPVAPLAIEDPPLALLLAVLRIDGGLHRLGGHGNVDADGALGAVDEGLRNDGDVEVGVKGDLALY